MKNKALIGGLLMFALTGVLWLVSLHSPGAISPNVLKDLRWSAIALLVVYGMAKRNVTTWILICMVAGACLGLDWPNVAVKMRVISMIFLRMVKTIIAPLLFATLVTGIAEHADLKKIGRMGLKAIIYFELVTSLALLIGLVAIHVSKAGVGIHLPPAVAVEPVAKVTAADTILHVFPENIAKSVADGQVLQVVVFSLLFGVGLAMVPEEKRKPMLSFCQSLTAVMFKFTNIVMLIAPLGVGAAIASAIGSSGLGVITNLAKMLATMYVALTIFILGVLFPIALLFKVPIRRFAKAVAEPFTIAFATTSSEAALPRAMERMEGLGVSREVVAFVLPTGYSFNLDGSTLYLSLATIFVAQAGGIRLGVGQQIVILLTLMLTSKGVAGVARASLVILFATVTSFGLPVEPVFILLGIDELMDMGRTATNVLGNCLATVVVAKLENEFHLQPEGKAEAVEIATPAATAA
jgi:Na+/H+-dicarboxylate symporter